VERRYNDSVCPHLRPLSTVDSVCTMGMVPAHAVTISTTIKNSHTRKISRGLFCAQLLARMLYPLPKTAIARHLPAHLVHAVNHGRMISAAKRLTDFDQLHFQ
jgi:hypothetical protein